MSTALSPTVQPATARVIADLLPRWRAANAVLIAAGAVLIGLSSQFYLPLPFTPVPLTGQTLAVLLVAAALGMRRGVAAAALYVLAGLAGVPWFAGGASGLPGSTAGYLIGFVAAAVVVGALAERGGDRSVARTVLTMVVGNAVIYAFGAGWLAAYLHLGVGKALALGVVPFLAGDAIKLVVAALALPACWRFAGRR
jgi:biotin transport system substrate-specific component